MWSICTVGSCQGIQIQTFHCPTISKSLLSKRTVTKIRICSPFLYFSGHIPGGGAIPTTDNLCMLTSLPWLLTELSSQNYVSFFFFFLLFSWGVKSINQFTIYLRVLYTSPCICLMKYHIRHFSQDFITRKIFLQNKWWTNGWPFLMIYVPWSRFIML